jgi:hypothetical protein
MQQQEELVNEEKPNPGPPLWFPDLKERFPSLVSEMTPKDRVYFEKSRDAGRLSVT